MSDIGAASENDILLIETEGAIRVLTLNRPHRANALSPQLSRQLGEELVRADDDADIRAIVITGMGDKAFCGGVDLKARAGSDAANKRMRTPTRGTRRLTTEVVLETWKPTIAAINGAAAGAGLELALACDLRIAASNARLSQPEARRGMGAHFATVMLPRLIPPAIAYEMLFLGAEIDAQRAYAVGLVNRVVETGAARAEALGIAQAIAQMAPITVRRMKETAMKSSGLPIAAAMRLNEGTNPYESEDRIEGVRAFVEKRAPHWKGR